MRKSGWSTWISLILLISLMVLEVSCVRTNPQREGKSGERKAQTQVYPHSSEFRTTLLHGEHYLQDRQSCTQCHNGASKASVCSACHQAYPHFESMSQHGTRFLSDPQQCRGCHESPKGKSPSCTQCHMFPHEQEWSKQSLHGVTFLKDPNQCLGCHKSDGKGSSTVKSCQDCHSYPHRSSWDLPDNHGEAYIANRSDPQAFSCLTCHYDESASTEPRGVPHCGSCHVEMPHPSGFTVKHKELAATYQGGCTNCHVNFERHMPRLKTCIRCHVMHGGKTLEIHWVETSAHQPVPKSPERATVKHEELKVQKRDLKRDKASIDHSPKE